MTNANFGFHFITAHPSVVPDVLTDLLNLNASYIRLQLVRYIVDTRPASFNLSANSLCCTWPIHFVTLSYCSHINFASSHAL
jgi:hypothetical protein